MNDSNWSLRFSRSAREAYGHDVQFESDPDKPVWTVAICALGFVLGFIVFGG